MLKTVVLLNIFVETVIHFFQDYLMHRKFKRVLSKVHLKSFRCLYCNLHCNTSLLNKNIDFFFFSLNLTGLNLLNNAVLYMYMSHT